jgi:hypothetical protein
MWKGANLDYYQTQKNRRVTATSASESKPSEKQEEEAPSTLKAETANA